MAMNRPEAVPSKAASPRPPVTSTAGAIPTSTTTTTSQSSTSSPVPGQKQPLRPPRSNGAKLVRPKDDDLQPPPTATAGQGACKSIGSGTGAIVGVRKSTCKRCTNISIMQLFYEMKQRFPTVPDDVVNGCVLDHCHERERLLTALREHSEGNQTLIPHAYPGKALLGEQQKCDNRRNAADDEGRQSNTNTIPRRSKGGGGLVGSALVSAAVPLVGMVSGGANFRRQSDTNSPPLAAKNNGRGLSSDMLSNGGTFLSNNIQRMAGGGGGGGGGGGDSSPLTNNNNKVERPRTLNLSSAPNRPFRAAPPIPSTTSSTSSLSSLSTATDLASASSPQLTASNESINVSVNVTLSPILAPRPGPAHVAKPPIPPPRHTTELTVQPEMLPFSAATTTAAIMASGLPSRSFTSVNFTLRQPTSGDQGNGAGPAAVPIDFTAAGSSMTYSSSSYNAKEGYQNQLQITVGNGGGSISAFRTKAPTIVTQGTSTSTGAGNRTISRLDTGSEEILINRQLQSKWKLSTELDKYKKRLEGMQREVRTLQLPLPASAPAQLQQEIERLQKLCDRMAAAVEEAGNFALGETNEAFYQRLDSQRPSLGGSSSTTTPTTTAATPPAESSTAAAPTPAGAGALTTDETEQEGWTCCQCTFQNHPELNMCEQCGMMRPVSQTRLPVPVPVQQQQQSPQQQQQPSPMPPAGIVQITSSQFIPAPTPVVPVPNPPPGVSLTNPPQPPQYVLHNYSGHAPGPRMVYTPPMVQYPQSAFVYPPANVVRPGVSPVGVYNSGVMHSCHTTPTTSTGTLTTTTTSGSTGSGTERSPKRKRKPKFNSKFSQSISNLFSSSSSSSNPSGSGGAAGVNSQE